MQYIALVLGGILALFLGLRKAKPNKEKENKVLQNVEKKLIDELKGIDEDIKKVKVEDLSPVEVVDYWNEEND